MQKNECTKAYMKELASIRKALYKAAEKVDKTTVPDMVEKEKYTLIWWMLEAVDHIDRYLKGRDGNEQNTL